MVGRLRFAVARRIVQRKLEAGAPEDRVKSVTVGQISIENASAVITAV